MVKNLLNESDNNKQPYEFDLNDIGDNQNNVLDNQVYENADYKKIYDL